MDAAALLANTLSPDADLRNAATTQLQEAARDHLVPYLSSLSDVLASTTQPAHIRNAAGLQIKNILTARESARSEEYAARWRAIPPEDRQKAKDVLIRCLGDEARQVRQVAGQGIAAIGSVELPAGLWNGLIVQLLGVVNNPSNGASLRQATLQAIGYICESTVGSPRVVCCADERLTTGGAQRSDVLATQTNEILTAVVSGARKEEPSADVQLAAVNALYNSLDFVRENFDREASPLACPREKAGSDRTGRASETTSCRSSARRPNPPLSTSRSLRSAASSRSCSSTTRRCASTWNGPCSGCATLVEPALSMSRADALCSSPCSA